MSSDQKLVATNKRRQFIKKASAGVAVSSLPMQSVWGACSVSGIQSGNVSQTGGASQCSMPFLSGGRNPEFWYQGNTLKLGHNDKSIKSAFTALNSSGTTTADMDAYRMQVLTVRGCVNDSKNRHINLQGLTMGLDPAGVESLTGGMKSTFTPYEGFQTQGSYSNVFWHVAAAYMNTYFKFYSGALGGQTEADAVANAVMINYMAGTTALTDAEMGYTNGSSSIVL